MEKIVCNVLYEPICFTIHKDNSAVDHSLKFFEEKKDAIKAVELFFNAIKETQEEINIKTYGSFRIDKIIKPENSSCCFYENIEQFMLDNPYVNYYLKTKKPALYEATKKYLEVEAKQSFPHPHDSLTDEEDNFC